MYIQQQLLEFCKPCATFVADPMTEVSGVAVEIEACAIFSAQENGRFRLLDEKDSFGVD
jgi:hypothetical protein